MKTVWYWQMFPSTRHGFNTVFSGLTDTDQAAYTETAAADRKKKKHTKKFIVLY